MAANGTRMHWRTQRVSNADIKRRIFGPECQSSFISSTLKMHRRKWLGHDLRMPRSHLPHRAVFAEPSGDRLKVRGAQIRIRPRESKSSSRCGWCTSSWLGSPKLAEPVVGVVGDIVAIRSQWRDCCRCVTEVSVKLNVTNRGSESRKEAVLSMSPYIHLHSGCLFTWRRHLNWNASLEIWILQNRPHPSHFSHH